MFYNETLFMLFMQLKIVMLNLNDGYKIICYINLKCMFKIFNNKFLTEQIALKKANF